MISILNIALIYIYHASTVLFPIKQILNIDKYFVCESRDMSDESGTYIILLKLKKLFCSLGDSIILAQIHIL